MNHTCSAVAALLSTASPLPLAPAGPCSWDSSCAQLLRFPGLRGLPGPGGSPRHGVPRAGMLPQLIVPGLAEGLSLPTGRGTLSRPHCYFPSAFQTVIDVLVS